MIDLSLITINQSKMMTYELKKEIVTDWKNSFSQLSIYSLNKLYGIAGIVIIGIELIKVIRNDDYRPHIMCYPLWNKTNKENLLVPIVFQEVSNMKNMQCDIPYDKHRIYFEEAVLCTKKQAYNCLDVPVTIDSILNLIDAQMSELLVRCSPVAQSRLYQLKLFIALYINNYVLINKVMNEIKEVSMSWESQYFNSRYGKVNDWILYLEKTLENRDDFFNQIEQNRMEKKISRLNNIQIIY